MSKLAWIAIGAIGLWLLQWLSEQARRRHWEQVNSQIHEILQKKQWA